jgi:essential nuclear protein 1
VLWHQSLLVFVQRYKQDIKREQKEQFKELFKKHQHRSITPEVQRELFSSRARGEKAPQTTTSMLD